jgi:hypothetical protein
MSDHEGALHAYLGALYGRAPEGSLVELRYRVAHTMRQRFYPAQCADRIATSILRRSQATDVYVGVLPRQRCGGRRSDVVCEANVVWVDCDNAASAQSLSRFTPAPSLVVRSGTATNVHGYWLLDESLDLDAIEDINRRLASLLGGDAASTDASRILRPPRSLNHKRRPPVSVSLELWRVDVRVTLDELLADLPVVPSRGAICYSAREVDADPLRELTPAVYVERLTGAVVPRGHKIACPFHADRTPSLHVYDEPERGWTCYGCRRGGTVYDFAAYLWGTSTRGDEFRELRVRLLRALL